MDGFFLITSTQKYSLLFTSGMPPRVGSSRGNPVDLLPLSEQYVALLRHTTPRLTICSSLLDHMEIRRYLHKL